MTLECLGVFFLIEYSLRSSRRGFELEVRVRSEFRLLSYHKVSDTAPLSFDFPPEINQLSNIKLSSHTQFRDQALQNREYLAAGGGCFFEVEISRLGAERKSWMYG